MTDRVRKPSRRGTKRAHRIPLDDLISRKAIERRGNPGKPVRKPRPAKHDRIGSRVVNESWPRALGLRSKLRERGIGVLCSTQLILSN